MTKYHQKQMWLCLIAAIIIAFLYWFKPPFSFAYDPHDETCLPDLRLSFLVHRQPEKIQRGDYLFWRPSGALSYIKQEFVLKQVSGIPGDRLTIQRGVIKVNDKVVAQGLPLIDRKKVDITTYQRDEVIPDGYVFMTGTHPRSNDSRYWGYLDIKQVVGKGYKIL